MSLSLLKLRRLVSSAFRRRDDDHGAATIEYALLLVLIGVITLIAVAALGGEVSSSFRSTGQLLDP